MIGLLQFPVWLNHGLFPSWIVRFAGTQNISHEARNCKAQKISSSSPVLLGRLERLTRKSQAPPHFGLSSKLLSDRFLQFALTSYIPSELRDGHHQRSKRGSQGTVPKWHVVLWRQLPFRQHPETTRPKLAFDSHCPQIDRFGTNFAPLAGCFGD
jgi:hypothetical protein